MNLLAHAGSTDSLTLVLLVALHAALLGLPALAGLMVALRLGVRSHTMLVVSAILTTAAYAYLAFWIYLAGDMAGRVFSDAFLLASLILTIALWRTLPRGTVALLRPLWVPGALVVLTALFIVGVGFLYGGLDRPLAVSGNRFSHVLPSDNAIPLLFAQALDKPSRPLPSNILGDWLFSDRPPLQAGYVAAQFPFFRFNPELQYEVLGVILQCLSVLGLWVYLAERRASRSVRAIAIAVTITSGFFFVNSFYVWPKLLPAGFLLLLAALLLTDRYHLAKESAIAGVACGLLAGFAMLGHEGSAFGLAAIGLTMLTLKRVPATRFLLPAALAVAVCLVPWTWYQHVYDPPGDRLLKWHLGGQIAVTTEGSLAAIVHGYQRAGLTGTLGNKVLNVGLLLGDPRVQVRAIGRTIAAAGPGSSMLQSKRRAADAIRAEQFYHFFPALGLMALGPLAVLVGVLEARRRGARPPPELVDGAVAWLCVGFGLFVWCLTLFGPATTWPHQGTYLFELLAFGGSASALAALSPRLLWAIGLLEIVFSLLVYVVLTPSPGSIVDIRQFGSGLNPLTAAISLLAFLAILAVLAAAEPGTRSNVPSISKQEHAVRT